MAKKLDVYFPLIIGDWLKGTRGMKAEVKGVYIGLLLYQWDNHFLPSSLDDLMLIEPEVGKVWVSISAKFKEVEPGKLQNDKVEEVRAFFLKQAKNGSKGGAPKKENPNSNPNNNPKHNLHNELELDIELESKVEIQNGVQGENESPDNWHSEQVEQWIKQCFTPEYIKRLKREGFEAYPGINFDQELERFKLKARGSPTKYSSHNWGLRQAFELQLGKAKPTNGNGKSTSRKQEQINEHHADFMRKHGGLLASGTG